MSTAGFLEQLRRLQVHVRIEGDAVRVSAPRGVLSQELQAELARRKPEILAYMRNGGGDPGRPPMTRADRNADLPLSFAQQRVWFLEQLEPGTSDYTIAVRKRHYGTIDVDILRRALGFLVERHESLRTTFTRVGSEPVQRIGPPRPVDVRTIDLRHLPVEARRESADRSLRIEAARPFDIERGPLFRACLIHLADDEHELLIAMHHLVADGWSIGLLAHEFGVAYEAVYNGEEPQLPELPYQYADYAVWQREWLTGDVLDEQARFWRNALGGAPAALELPTDYPRNQDRPRTAGGHEFGVPQEAAVALRELARSEGATLFMAALAVFDILLGRYSGQEDLVVGTPIANRAHPDVQGMVGFFANTLALRADLSGDPSFRELLARVRDHCLDAYAHQDMPFERLVEELRPERSPGRNPIFQVSFVLQGHETGADFDYVTAASPFEMTLFLRERASELLGAVEYRSDLFEWETMARMSRHFVNLLQAAVANPDAPISRLNMLDEQEQRRLLFEWNDTATAYPHDRSVTELFEDRVDATPNAVALRFAGQAVTYDELDRRANQLAHHLIAKGVKPGAVVGTLIDRSIEAIVSTIAVLKAGAVYAPLDPLAPPERLGWILEDARADVVLTTNALSARLPRDVRSIRVDVGAGAIAERQDARTGIHVGPMDPAYVMFTSGTSGRPKGVVIPHRGIVRLVCGNTFAHFGPDEVMLQLATFSFDAATFEIWGALLHGARLAIAPPGTLSLEEIETELARESVTTFFLTTALFHQLAEHRVSMLRGVRQLVVGGDVLAPRAARTALAACPDLRLVNGYGPTENTTFTTCHTVAADVPLDRPIPIGRPIANTRVYILDRDMNPVPVGVPGELWTAGDGLALGYANRPDFTEEKFITDTLPHGVQERLYRTGDRVRWRNDGTIEFLGRFDDQVKLRGFRVEPAEIEATLLRMSGVHEAAVLVRVNGGGERKLIAWVVAPGLSDAEIRGALREFLPEYMVPAEFVLLDALPMTPSGKLDRRALPDPRRQRVAPYVGARDEIEQKLVAIWQEVLERDSIGVHDDFFDLGGHSLLAVELFTRIETAFGITLPLATLFRAPTPEGLARLIRAGRRPRVSNVLVPIRASGHRSPIFAVPGVGGNVLSFRDLAHELPADRPFYGLQSLGLEGDAEPLTSIEQIATTFLEQVREVQPRGPYHFIGACMGGVVAYEMAQQLRAAGEDVALLGLLETWPPELTPENPTVPRGRFASLTLFLWNRVRMQFITLSRLRGRERLRFVAGRADRLAGAVIRRSLPDVTLNDYRLRRVEQANLFAVRNYVPKPYDGSAVAILAADRPIVGEDYRHAWKQLVRGGIQVFAMPGADSGLMIKPPHAGPLARRLLEFLGDT